MLRSPKFLAAAGIGGIAVLAFVAFGVFGIHTAFIDETVSEENPFANVSTTAAAPEVVTETEAVPVPADEATDTSGDTTDDASETSGETDADPAAASDLDDVAETAVAESAEQPPDPEPTAVPAAPQIVTLGTGMLVDHDHSGTGTATVLSDGTQTFLRFEDDFAVDNGPDLNVYLVRGADAEGDPGLFDDDFIDLGDLKGNIGAQNYEVPAGVDIAEYSTVVIWCVRFGVAFNAANLA